MQPKFTGLLAIIAALNRPRIILAKVVQTCAACPSQWDAWTTEGQYLYLRYRFGVGAVTTDHNSGTDDPVAAFNYGSDLAGSISLEDFMDRAGLDLAPNADVS